MVEKSVTRKISFEKIANSVADEIRLYQKLYTASPHPKKKIHPIKKNGLGPRGPRAAQYNMLADIYKVMLAYPPLKKLPREDDKKAIEDGAEFISLLMSLAFKLTYKKAARSKRQRLRVWSDVVKWLWVHHVNPDEGVVNILNDGGIDMVSIKWTSKKGLL